MCAPTTSHRTVAIALAAATAVACLLWAGLVVGGVQLFHLIFGGR